ncbi:MAG: CRTAC1 family protein [Chthonomonadales bacterium]
MVKHWRQVIAECLLTLPLAGCTVSGLARANGRTVSARASDNALFRNVAQTCGIRFRLTNGAEAQRYAFVESTPAGCAFLDYDNDGWPDILLIQAGPSPGTPLTRARPSSHLYHNNGDGTFTDVTTGSGLDRDLGYAQGVAVGDFDNDGFDDLFITAYGGNHLLRNEHGSGRFTDVTKAAGLDGVHSTGYATSAAWGDYDRDGWLDLYVCYYTPWSPATDKPCKDPAGRRDYCSPQIYDPDTHVLYHNDHGHFRNVSAESGIGTGRGRGLSAAWIDYNGDGWPDIFVANDLTPAFLWRNNRNGTFTDVAMETGCAMSGDANEMAGMGIGIADYDHSGRESIFVTNFSGMPNALFRNIDGRRFDDVGMPAGVAQPHMRFLSFGCEFLDYDADSWPDLFIADGHVQIHADAQTDGVTYAEPKQLMHNNGDGTFTEVTDPALLGDLLTPRVSRGLAIGDYDNDGRLDVLVNNQNDDAELFHNEYHGHNHWISFRLTGVSSNKDAIGAEVTVAAGSVHQRASVRGGSSYLSTSDRRVYFGLGGASRVDVVTIRWPSGLRQMFHNLTCNAHYQITEGHHRAYELPVRPSHASSAPR